MARLDIRAVKAHLLGTLCRRNELFSDRIQIRIRDDAVVCDRALFLKDRGMVRDQGRRHTLGLAVTPRVGQLHDHDRLKAVLFFAGLLDLSAERGVRRHGRVVKIKLARIGSALGQNGGRLIPDDASAPARKAQIAAAGQLVGCARGSTVTALHRLIHDAVRNNAVADRNRLGKARNTLVEREAASRLPRHCLKIGTGQWYVSCHFCYLYVSLK